MAHVSTEQNPADLLSRGINAEYIIDNSLWWSGPDWLLKDEDDRPRIDGGNPPRGMKESKNLTALVSHHATIKILMINRQPVRRHYHPKYTLITLAPVSYLRSLVVRAVHRHRTGVGSIPAGRPIVDEFFSTVPG